LPFADQLSDRRRLGIDRRGIRPHFDPLTDIARFELEIDALHLVDVQLDVGLHRELEPFPLGSDEIIADGQQRHDIVADVAGCRLTGETGLLAGDDHLDARHHGAAGVGDGARDLAGGGLRIRARCESQTGEHGE
jgi:hypothetical protein